MKKILLILFSFVTLVFLLSCGKRDYSIRFKNEYREGIYNIKAGNAFLGRADTGQTTGYQKFTGRSFVISGTADSGQQMSGTESVSGKGTHKWTITLNKEGKFNFAED